MTAVDELPAITRKRENSIRLGTLRSLYNFSRSTGGRIDLIGLNALENVGVEQTSVRAMKSFTDAIGTLDVSATVTNSGKQSVRKRTRNHRTLLPAGSAT
jgi:3-oxoacyl-ACP reductase-like protein